MLCLAQYSELENEIGKIGAGIRGGFKAEIGVWRVSGSTG